MGRRIPKEDRQAEKGKKVIPVGVDNTVPVIKVTGLRKSFGGMHAVDGIDLTVRKGSIHALLGPNGAGKSTTVKILEGLLKRDEGEVRVLGDDPWRELDMLKAKIGVMPQEFNFFEQLTPFEALSFYGKLFSLEVNPSDLLNLVILEESSGTRFENLSGGQKQKLGLALSLVNNPEVLFLDEPTTGLDPTARRAIWAIIRSFRKQGKTIVLTTHYLEEAEQLADYVSIIDHGRIVADGTPADIVEKYGSGRKLVIRAGSEMLETLRAKGYKVSENGNALEIKLNENVKLLDLVSAIELSGIDYEQLTVRTDSLEDVFVGIVGRMPEGEMH